jgi:hypothetical protein
MRELHPRAPGIYRFIARMPRGGSAPPTHSGRWVGALVASLRSHILRPGAGSIADVAVSSRSFSLPPVAVAGYNYLVLPGFMGRF